MYTNISYLYSSEQHRQKLRIYYEYMYLPCIGFPPVNTGLCVCKFSTRCGNKTKFIVSFILNKSSSVDHLTFCCFSWLAIIRLVKTRCKRTPSFVTNDKTCCVNFIKRTCDNYSNFYPSTLILWLVYYT